MMQILRIEIFTDFVIFCYSFLLPILVTKQIGKLRTDGQKSEH